MTMNKRYIQTIILTLALLVGAAGEAWALGESDIIIDPVSPTGSGTVEFKSITEKIEESVTVGWTVTITVTPADGFFVKKENVIAQKLQNLGQAQSRRRTPAIADALTVSGLEESDVATDYTFDVPTGYAGALVKVTFTSKITPGYYVLHQSGKGYLKVSGVGVNLGNDDTFQSGNLFDKGNCIWYVTSDGYVQNEYFYLNVANNQTLYLSVDPVTKWRMEDIENETKKHLKINDGTNDLYLCYDGGIKLKNSTSAYYNACPVNVTEKEWNGTPTADNLTLQSPQLVTYLRAYFTQKIDYSFDNDDDPAVTVSATDHERRVYATLAYASDDDGKGTNWDIDAAGVIYNKKASGDAEFTATYNILPADKKALADHSTPVPKDIKYKVTQKAFAPAADMDYLLFSIPGEDNKRYPLDDGTSDVVAQGKGGTGIDSELTDPLNDGSGRNGKISWKVTVDSEGFYTFQNKGSNKYLYFDETPHASSDYGVLKVGTSPSGNSAKFRLYKTTDSNYGNCYYIIPYSKQFAVYKSDGVADGLYAALNFNQYSGVLSLFKSNTNSTWCIYKYEAEYRVRGDFTLSGPTTASAAGNYEFTSEGWYGKYIKESPKNGSAQNAMVISGTYKDANNIDYKWTVTGLGNYISITDGTNTDGTWTKTTTGDANNRKLIINVPSLPASSASGVVQLQLIGGTDPNKKSSENKTIAFTIMGDGSVVLQEITSLSAITSSSGAYKLTANQTYSESNKPGVVTFSGILDCDGHTISGLNAPLFTTITNGTVRNVTLSGVNITSNTGPTGAIAGTANGGSRIYNVGIIDGDGKVGSSDDVCGGLVGLLDGSARVINCFSYADITGGTIVGGIVGKNNYKTTANDVRTMVMNCMFYGNITGGTSKAPIYNGEIISNVGETGVGNYNYFRLEAPYVQPTGIIYNCALGAEDRFLQRFEFYRHLLNSHRELAGWWATGTYSSSEMMKWVLEPSQLDGDTPYPILKASKDQNGIVIQYPSVVNIDAKHATIQTERNKGGKLGTLSVTIQMGSGGAVYAPPTGASITTSSLTLNITDKDPDHYNFNYYKVQLPYYNDVGTKNYNGNRVVTGWKIVGITGGTPGSFNTGDDATVDANGNITESAYNFADRNCTDKDLYSVSGRVFNQGAYWDVPEGVSAITIEPYWAKCAYLADAYADVVYNTAMTSATNVPNVGGGQKYSNRNSYSIAGESQMVFTSKGDAIATSKSGLFQGATGSGDHTVYDYAVVLVGNYHFYGNLDADMSKPYTVTSVDLDNDNEPDYSYILRFDSRKKVHPVRVDFINIPGLGMAQKSTGGTGSYNFGIMQPKGWFESTNTSLFRETQFEYDNTDRVEAPYILQGGVMEQWVSGQSGGAANLTTYFHVGGNVWFKEFHRGTHQDYNLESKHPPVSVTGGDFDEFYLTGLYKAVTTQNDNAECYISGGRFGIVVGTGMEGIGDATNHTNGNITWQISYADIREFYGGGINAKSPVQGDITTVIKGSHVRTFCGGPKFGDMWTGRTVKTTATNCEFGTYFGAGYGGNSYSRQTPYNYNNKMNIEWNKWVKGEIKAENDNNFNGYQRDYKKVTSGNRGVFEGVSTQFSYQFLPMSGNADNCARLFIDYVMFSLATTHGITSNLTGCTVTGNFYGGGSLGKVAGNVTSTLTDCTVKGNVFGAGFSASLPTVEVDSIGFRIEPYYYDQLGTYRTGVKGATTTYTWEQNSSMTNPVGIDPDKPILYTKENLAKSNLGSVAGNVTLTIKGNSVIGTAGDTTKGNVFGGGEESYVTPSIENGNPVANTGNTEVNIQGNTEVLGNVFGGGDNGEVQGSTKVNIKM